MHNSYELKRAKNIIKPTYYLSGAHILRGRMPRNDVDGWIQISPIKSLLMIVIEEPALRFFGSSKLDFPLE